MKLNPRQEQFCFEYAKSGNAGASYQKVYGTTNSATAATNAYRLLKNADIQSRLKEIQDELANSKIMDAKEIQERLTAIGRGTTSEVVVTAKGERIRKQVSTKDMLKAIEILCRIQSLFVDRKEITSTTPIIIGGGDCLVD